MNLRLFLSFLGISMIGLSLKSQTFTNIAETQGIYLTNQVSIFGCGVSFVDFNRDGWDDITFGTKNTPIRFYQNNEGVFEQITLQGVSVTNVEIKQICWVDFDNDGDYDLNIAIRDEPYRLYRNNGDMTFELLNPLNTGLPTFSFTNRNICWGDYDRDGDLDVYLAPQDPSGTGIFEVDYPKMNHLYRNNGDYTFTDVTMEAGVQDSLGITYGTVWWDYDRDGWPDLYVANDKAFDNALYHNNGDGTFTDIGAATGSDIIMDSMCASPADYDNDGDLDMFITNTSLAGGGVGNVLLKNEDGNFVNSAPSIGLNLAVTNCWGASWLDYNNDGLLDIYVAANQTSPNFPGLNRLYRNDGSNFTQVNNSTGLNEDLTTAFANAVGDINNDGYPDIVSHTQHPFAARIYLNSGATKAYLKIFLEGTVSNRDGVGSFIDCWTNGLRQTRYTMCGKNFMGQDSYSEIIGLGGLETVDSLVITWNSGHIDKFYDVPVNQKLHILEGSSLSAALNISGTVETCEFSESLFVGEFSSYLWSNGSTDPSIQVDSPGSYSVLVTNQLGIPIQSDTLTIAPLEEHEPLAEVLTEMISCPGLNDGIINVLPNQPDYSINMNGNEGLWLIDFLPPGTYSFEVSNSFGCSSHFEVEIDSPEELEYQILTSTSCAIENTGELEIYDSNYPINSISWNVPGDTPQLSNLAGGEYHFNIEYHNGCLHEGSVTIDEYPELIANAQISELLCHGDSSGSVWIDDTIMSQLASLHWFNGDTTALVNNLPSGVYTYEYTDQNACFYQSEIEIPETEELLAESSINPSSNPNCPLEWMGEAEVYGGSEPHSLEWSFLDPLTLEVTELSGNSWECLGPGALTLTVTDANDCVFTESFELEAILSDFSMDQAQWTVYPNPSDGLFIISGELNSEAVFEVHDSTGRLVRSFQFQQSPVYLDLSDLESGWYLLSMMDGERMNSAVLLIR